MQSTSPVLGHHRDPAAEDLHGCPLPSASPTVEAGAPLVSEQCSRRCRLAPGPGGSLQLPQGPVPPRPTPEKHLHQVPGGQSTHQDQAKPTSPGRRKWHQLQGKMQKPEPGAAPLPAVPAGHKNAAPVLGYCAAQGLTRAGTRRQEGVKHLSGLVCRLHKRAVRAPFLPIQGCREVGKA